MKSCTRRFFLVGLFVLLGLAVSRVALPADGYHPIAKKVLGGEGFWDYLTCDSVARRLYISRGTHVMGVDADSLEVVGDIPNTEGVHGIALASAFGRGFVSDGRCYTVSIVDLTSLKRLGTVPTGAGPVVIIS